jgi:hypothetical protein
LLDSGEAERLASLGPSERQGAAGLGFSTSLIPLTFVLVVYSL